MFPRTTLGTLARRGLIEIIEEPAGLLRIAHPSRGLPSNSISMPPQKSRLELPA